MPVPENGSDICTCKKKNCIRHGKCKECIENHETKNTLPYCKRKNRSSSDKNMSKPERGVGLFNRKSYIITALALLVIVALLFLYPVCSVNHVRECVNSYLTQTKGYDESEYTVNVSYHALNNLLRYSPYVISVVFNDEPNVIYYYHYYSNGDIICSSAGDRTNPDYKNFKH